jgi:hypothetical protein
MKLKCKDDAGKPIAVEVADRSVLRDMWQPTRFLRPAVAVMMLVILTGTGVYVMMIQGGQGQGPVIIAGPIFLVVLYLAVIDFAKRRNAGSRAIAAKLRTGRCGQCNYDLKGLLQSDQVICPECGAAWNRERFELPVT